MNPNSRLWLCKTNLENDYKNTLTFSSITNQRNYFIGDPSDLSSHGVSTKMYTDFTYLRIEQAIKVDDFIENIDTNNYLVILNNTKYYYYFITSMDYIDDSTTKINIELDVMQTYFFNIEYKQSFVEREHVTDDIAGKHTIPEGLETGEYIVGSSGNFDWSNAFDGWSVVMAVALSSDIFSSGLNFWQGNIYSGTGYISFPMDDVLISQAGIFLDLMNNNGRLDEIVAVFMYPTVLLDTDSYMIHFPSVNISCYIVNPTTTHESFPIVIGNKPTKLGTYTPRNKKLLTSDYTFMLVDNGAGSTKKYNFEDFKDRLTSGTYDINFDINAVLTPAGSTIYVPENYKNVTNNLLESFAGAKYPICSFSGDTYTNWLTQNGINQQFQNGENLLKGVGGLGATLLGGMTGNVPLTMLGVNSLSAGISNALTDVVQDMEQKRLHQNAPDEVKGNIACGDIMYCYNKCRPKYYYMHIKEEYCKIIDKFFDQFGYQVNILKTPSIHTRTNWNYLKTKNCNFTGDIPQEYMCKIKAIFDNGITFWHNPTTMLDYTQTNSVIS